MEQKKYTPAEIALCSTCKGEGKVKSKNEQYLFKHPFAKQMCDVCEGSGLVIFSSVTIETITPYKPTNNNETKS